jgi:hypothetical protein
MEFVQYSRSEGYEATLAIAPEAKFPVRRGTADNPTEFADLSAALDVGVGRKAPLGNLCEASMFAGIVGGHSGRIERRDCGRSVTAEKFGCPQCPAPGFCRNPRPCSTKGLPDGGALAPDRHRASGPTRGASPRWDC